MSVSASSGTSSSGVQVVAALVDEVAELVVLQRSPNWCTPLNNRPITDDEQRQLRADFEQLREVLSTHPGLTEVRLRLLARNGTTVMRLDDRLRVAPSPELYADLKPFNASYGEDAG